MNIWKIQRIHTWNSKRFWLWKGDSESGTEKIRIHKKKTDKIQGAGLKRNKQIFKKLLETGSGREAIYIDETGFNEYYYREYGWSKRGISIEGKKRGLRYSRINLVARKIEKRVLIVMDNARFHRKNILEKIIKGTGHCLLFLSPYSPDLNPIEKLWANMKKKLKDIAHNFNTLEEAATFVLFNKLVQF